MATLRIDKTDNGSVLVWDDRDPDTPILIPKRHTAAYCNADCTALEALGRKWVDDWFTLQGNQPDRDVDDFSDQLDALEAKWSAVQAKIANDTTKVRGRKGEDLHAAMALAKKEEV